MKKISYKILKKMCYSGSSNDGSRNVIREPFRIGDYWCATDLMILLIAKAEACEDNIPDNNLGMYPKVFGFIDPAQVKSEFVVTLKDLNKAFDQCPKIDETQTVDVVNVLEKCPACDGDGEICHNVRFRGRVYESLSECPICHGFGKVPVDDKYDPDRNYNPIEFKSCKQILTGKSILDEAATISINGMLFRASLFNRICEYMEFIGADSVKFSLKDKMIVLEFPYSMACIMSVVGLIDNISPVVVETSKI